MRQIHKICKIIKKKFKVLSDVEEEDDDESHKSNITDNTSGI